MRKQVRDWNPYYRLQSNNTLESRLADNAHACDFVSSHFAVSRFLVAGRVRVRVRIRVRLKIRG